MVDKCKGPECTRDAEVKGYCNGHYVQTRRGKTLAPLRKVRKRNEITERDHEGNKQCNKCLLWLSENSYAGHKNTLDKLQATCRRCAARDHKLRHYGVDTYYILEQQGNRCRICGVQEGDTDRLVWHIDHDHSCCSGKKSCGACVRGVLCQQCNQGLGNFNDSIESLRNAVRYLELANSAEGDKLWDALR